MSPAEYRCLAFAVWHTLPPGERISMRKLEDTYVGVGDETSRSLLRSLLLSWLEDGLVVIDRGDVIAKTDATPTGSDGHG